ncbi:MAG: transglutaminase domain-containing protein [Oscillospiraceae bacterium]
MNKNKVFKLLILLLSLILSFLIGCLYYSVKNQYEYVYFISGAAPQCGKCDNSEPFMLSADDIYTTQLFAGATLTSGKGPNCKRILTIKEGETVTVIGTYDLQTYILYDGHTGYIDSSVVPGPYYKNPLRCLFKKDEFKRLSEIQSTKVIEYTKIEVPARAKPLLDEILSSDEDTITYSYDIAATGLQETFEDKEGGWYKRYNLLSKIDAVHLLNDYFSPVGEIIYRAKYRPLGKDMYKWMYEIDVQSVKELNEKYLEYDKELSKILSEITTSTMLETAALRNIYQYILATTTYEREKAFASDILESGYGKCTAYAHLLKSLATRCGIETYYIVGNSDKWDIAHAWNSVIIDNQEYYIDATFGDTGYKYSKFFLMSAADMAGEDGDERYIYTTS